MTSRDGGLKLCQLPKERSITKTTKPLDDLVGVLSFDHRLNWRWMDFVSSALAELGLAFPLQYLPMCP
jgi:hypothetical protein